MQPLRIWMSLWCGVWVTQNGREDNNNNNNKNNNATMRTTKDGLQMVKRSKNKQQNKPDKKILFEYVLRDVVSRIVVG
jgi:hypothetical protein